MSMQDYILRVLSGRKMDQYIENSSEDEIIKVS
jgi:hypothetical protein